MGNRNIQQKILKMKRHNRHAVFSGSSSKYAVRVDTGRWEGVTKVGQEPNEDYVPSGYNVTIPVGQVSLSKAVINTGRGPDNTKMQEYYARIHGYDQSLPATIGAVSIDLLKSGRRTEGGLRLKDFDLGKKYAEFIKGAPQECRIRLEDNPTGVLDLFFTLNQWFFVDVDYTKKTLRRSRVYPSKAFAMQMLKDRRITWVERLAP